jgi:hypothetical protein
MHVLEAGTACFKSYVTVASLTVLLGVMAGFGLLANFMLSGCALFALDSHLVLAIPAFESVTKTTTQRKGMLWNALLVALLTGPGYTCLAGLTYAPQLHCCSVHVVAPS